MTFDTVYPLIRTVLGDEQVHGIWFYEDDRLDSAIKTVFLLGHGPDGYALNDAQNQIVPDLKVGDSYALVTYQAAMLLINGEDGAMRVQTRPLSWSDEGHRKRDLLSELRLRIHEIRDGAAVFTTFQTFESFLNSLRERGGIPYPLQSSEVNVTPGPTIGL